MLRNAKLAQLSSMAAAAVGACPLWFTFAAETTRGGPWLELTPSTQSQKLSSCKSLAACEHSFPFQSFWVVPLPPSTPSFPRQRLLE